VGAFERIYRVYVDRIHALCLRLCGDPQRAEDLTQEVFLRVWERIEAFEGRSRFYTWLYRVAVNRVMDALRSDTLRRRREVSDDVVPVAERPAKAGAPSLTAIDLESALATLPAGARSVFVLHDVEGYTHEEIASMAGIAVGTSKAQLHRARGLLRQRLVR
jgi:RNA polymerase sigma-70 factor (ECF subfamily)